MEVNMSLDEVKMGRHTSDVGIINTITTVFSFAFNILIYQFVIRHFSITRILFGLK
jgi:hypothetical protein